MSLPLRCLTTNDIRGRIPTDFNEQIALRLALAFTSHFNLRQVVVGRDMRLSSPLLAETIIAGLCSQGIHVIDIGLCGTEEVYHAVFSNAASGVDGGIMITASHNPADYNGMKLVIRHARPVSADNGLLEIAELAAGDQPIVQPQATSPPMPGLRYKLRDKRTYINTLLSLAKCSDIVRPLHLVVNSGNGCAGPVLDLLATHLPFTFTKLHHEPDGNFPNGVPNPLLPERREDTAKAVREHGADLGIAWDGDFDRCFFFDETGRFLEGYYIVGLLAEAMLRQFPGATILHDPRLTWNTREIVQRMGGQAIVTRPGHAFIKEAMWAENAIYGGEMSAHHYFRDFGYCDSGMLPWLLVCSLLSHIGGTLSELCAQRIAAYPVSGEINIKAEDPQTVLDRVANHYADGEQEEGDGLSIAYPEYRFNLRCSLTEPLLRLNVETRANATLLQEKTEELLRLIRG